MYDPDECSGYECACTCERCLAEDDFIQERVRAAIRFGDPDWSWVDGPYDQDQETDALTEYYADLASSSGYVEATNIAQDLGYVPRHDFYCQCADCLLAKAEGRSSEVMRRNVTVVTASAVAEVIAGCEALLADSPLVKFYEWCRENGRE